MKKSFDLGLIVGRFQAFHNGHKYMIDKALDICDTVGVLIGSSQESGTQKNPFDYETRKNILTAVYGDDVDIFPLPDIGVGNNSKWGDYVLENAEKRFGKKPDLLVSGKEERRIDWFDSVGGLLISELYVPKIIDISATRMREMLILNEKEEGKRFTDERLWTDFEKLRDIVLASDANKNTSSI